MNITNEHILNYVNNYYKPINNFMGELRQEAETDHVPIILKDTEPLLLELVKGCNPNTVLEIGTAVGYSALCFAYTAPSSLILTIERDFDMVVAARENFHKACMEDRISCIYGDAKEVLMSICRDVRHGVAPKFDFVFIDAAKSHYKEFFDLSLLLLSPKGMIICDNVLLKGGTASDQYDPTGRFKTNIRNMRSFIDYITDKEELSTTLIPVGDGLTISRLK